MEYRERKCASCKTPTIGNGDASGYCIEPGFSRLKMSVSVEDVCVSDDGVPADLLEDKLLA